MRHRTPAHTKSRRTLNVSTTCDNLLKPNVDFTAQTIKGTDAGLMDRVGGPYAEVEKRIGTVRVGKAHLCIATYLYIWKVPPSLWAYLRSRPWMYSAFSRTRCSLPS